MPNKKVNRSYWLEILGYSIATVVGVAWGLASVSNSPKLQEQRSPSDINSQY
jgi:hypothetical protein